MGRIQQWRLHWRQGAHPGHGHAPPGAHGTRHPQGGGRAPARRHGAISPAKITKIRTRIRILRIGSERKLRRASVRAGQKRPGGATGAGEYQQAGHRNMGQKILPGHVLTPHPPPLVAPGLGRKLRGRVPRAAASLAGRWRASGPSRGAAAGPSLLEGRAWCEVIVSVTVSRRGSLLSTPELELS